MSSEFLPTFLHRSVLLGFVLVLHAAFLFLFTLTKGKLPAPLEMPLIIDFIEPMAAGVKEPHATPLPMAAARPVVTKKAPPPRRQPAPALETTRTNELPADTAPTASVLLPGKNSAAEDVSGGAPGIASGSASGNALSPSGNPEGALVQARFDADYLKNTAPPYPPQSRRLGEEGKVILRVHVSPEGIAEEVEIRTSSGSSRLDDSALRTVRTWKFISAKRGNSAVASWVLVPIIFKLEQ